jgi:hypothetical protein
MGNFVLINITQKVGKRTTLRTDRSSLYSKWCLENLYRLSVFNVIVMYIFFLSSFVSESKNKAELLDVSPNVTNDSE